MYPQSMFRAEIQCMKKIRVFRVKLASCKSALNPSVVCSTDRSKAVVPVLVLLFVTLSFILRGDLLYVFPCHFVLVFFSPLVSGGAKVLCILHHWGVQLILAYSWARPAILVVGKGRGGMFLFLLFLHFHSCSSFFPVPLFHLLYSLFYLFSPFLWETTQNDPQGLTCR